MKIQVLEWDRHFENNKSRERDKCSFVCVPNKQHGVGLTHILSQPDGAAIYGVWCLLIGFLSRQKKPRDGHLTDTGGALGRHLTGTELAVLWRRSELEIARAFEVFCFPNVGWAIDLDKVPAECPLSAHVVPVECPSGAPEEKRIEEKGTEYNKPLRGGGSTDKKGEKFDACILPPELETPDFRQAWSDWQAYRREIKKPLRNMSLAQQLRDFSALGADRAIQQIRQSIKNGWQGLFAENGAASAVKVSKINPFTGKEIP